MRSRRFRSYFAIFMVALLLVTTVFPGSMPVYAAVTDSEPDKGARQINEEVGDEQPQSGSGSGLQVEHEQPERLSGDEDFTVDVTDSDLEELTLFYKSTADSEEVALPMESVEDGAFTATIPKQDLVDSRIEYWFEAESEQTLPYIVEVSGSSAEADNNEDGLAKSEEDSQPVEEANENEQNADKGDNEQAVDDSDLATEDSSPTANEDAENAEQDDANADEKNKEDVETKEEAETEEQLAIEHTPVTEMNQDTNITIEATVPTAENVTLQFQTGAQMEVQELSFTHVEDTEAFEVEIPTAALWSPTFNYKIIAEDANGDSVTYPETDYIEANVIMDEPDTQMMPSLLITEIAPDTDNRGGSDAYEFVEIYNNSDQPINIKDYQITYRYPNDTADQNWDLTEDKVIESQESFIVWMHNSGNQDLTIADFNANYDLNLTEDQVTIIENSGMANGAERTLVLADDFQNEISQVTYNDAEQDDVQMNQGIVYKYPAEGKIMQKVGVSEGITPHTIIPGQAPSKPVVVETDAETLVLGEPAVSMTEDAVTVKVDVTSEQDMLGANVHVSQSEAMGYQTLPMEAVDDGSAYSITIPLDMIWSDRVDYYFTASNQAGNTTTETYEIEIPQSTVDTQSLPKLLITEIAADTANLDGADAYEFIEIYNNTNQAINMSDYKLIYRYPTSTPDQLWDITDDKMIEPQESFIVWIHNDGNKQTTVADYNAQYGLDLMEDRVAIIENDGMANGSERTLVLTDEFDNVITEATYNDGERDVATDKGVMYKYPAKGNAMEKVGVASSISPLTVYPEQVPSEPVMLEVDAETPVIGEPSFDSTDEELTVQVEVTSEQALNGVNLYVSQSEAMGFKSLPMTLSEDASTYTVSIPAGEIWGDKLFYYFVASNPSGETTTDIAEFQYLDNDVDYQAVPPLLITEVVPDSANANGADAYEFIEVYNNTTETINYKDYTIRYRYPNTGPAGDLLWGPPVNAPDILIPSGESVVFWIINGGNTDKTAADFNAHYGSELVEGTNLIKIYSNGMSNSAERTLVMATKSGYELSEVSYFDDPAVDDTVADKGIFYRYPVDGGSTLSKISAGELDATPGEVLDEQVPVEKVQAPADTVNPVIEDTTEKESMTSEQAFQINATITDDTQVKSVFLHYRTVAGEDFRTLSLERTEGDRYQHTIYEPELIGQEQLEYYFVVSDGRNEVTTETKTISIEHPNMETGLRLNVDENELIAGEKVIKATEDAYTDAMELFIDEKQVTDTFMAMENEAYFAFDVSETNIYFKNGVTMGDEILSIFDDTYTDFVTLTVPIPADKLQAGENTITIRAGNKVSPFDETSTENRDDFTIKNARLVLADGTIITDPNYSDPNTNYAVGDSTGKEWIYDFNFNLEKEKFASLAYLFDTTTVADGAHEVTATLEDEEVSRNIVVDNTAPTIESSITDGKEYKGDFVIDAEVQDASEVTETTATLDGDSITLPYETSSAKIAAGAHELVITATDAAGNVGTEEIEFHVVQEHPWLPDWLDNNPDATGAELSVKVEDPTGDAMNIDFYQSYQYTAADKDNIAISQHSVGTEPPQSHVPEGETRLSDEDLALLAEVDGEEFSTESTTEFPYHRFDITVDEKVQPDDEIEIVWDGSSLEGRKVTMYAWNYEASTWDDLTSIIAGDEAFQLVGSVTGESYLRDGKVSVIVQDQIAAPGEDFTFVWTSDTQYYSESYPYIYDNQVEWIVENQDALNIEYVFHTGDVVNIWDDFDQWENADRAMKVLDDSGIPYGVLAGNHDVDQKDNNYTNYYTYFGDHRFEDRSYFGGSYKNNRGHYDLISVNGNDFIMVYMGWGVDQEGIDWINEVLAAHPNHKAILSFHEYLLASGTRSPIGDELFEKVVVPNENVHAVLSGHYHNSQTLIDEIDENGDGTADRVVYQLLADYQGGPEGGQGYIRLLNFNMETNQIDVQTYSPYMDDYNFYDPEEFPGKDEFTMDWDLTPQTKKVATDHVEVNVYTNNLIGTAENIPSGETASVIWDELNPETEYFWHVIASDAFGGSTRSDIWSFTTVDGEVVDPEVPEVPGEPEDDSGKPGRPGDGSNGKPSKPNKPGDGSNGKPGNSNKPGDSSNGKPGQLPNNNKQVVTPELADDKAILDDDVFTSTAKNGNIVIDLNDAVNLDVVEIQLSEKQIKLLKAKNITLTVQKDDITLDVPASVFNKKGEVIIKIERLKQIEDALSNVYDLTITQGNQLISEFTEAITLTLDVDPDNVVNPEHVHLFNLDEQTDQWDPISGSEFANSSVTAPVNHFSTFAAFEKELEKSTGAENKEKNDDTPIAEKASKDNGSSLPSTATNMYNYLLVGLLLIVTGTALALYYRKQRQIN